MRLARFPVAATLLAMSLAAPASAIAVQGPVNQTIDTISALRSVVVAVDTPEARPRAIQHTDAYYTRLTIHRIGSYVMFPLFASEYVIGHKLITQPTVSPSLRDAHAALSTALTLVFVTNLITGAINLNDASADPGAARRFLHVALMLASNAGFAYAGRLGRSARDVPSDAVKHRNVALASIGLSTAGTLMMFLWKN